MLAQVSGTVSGSVQDPGGAAVPGAQVGLYLQDGNKPVVSTTTSADGFFSLSGVRADSYKVTISAAGFAAYSLNNVQVNPASVLSLPPIKLELGTVATTVDVVDGASSVQTSTAEVVNVVSMQQVESLPVVDRSPLSLIGTQAGVLTTGRDNSTINGQRTSFSNVTLNGVNIQDNLFRTNALDFLPNLLLSGQVAEMTISTSNMDASQSAASAVTFVTPSGSNAFHGQVFYSNRNSYLAANSWFNNQQKVARPRLNQTQFGGSSSGRIIKDKLFFYANYEGFMLHQQSTRDSTILTQDARNGIFTYRDTSGSVQKSNILNLTGTSINSVIAPILSQLPTADKINNFNFGDSSAALSRNTGGYSFLGRNNRTRKNVTGTMDYVISSRQSVSGSYAWNSDLVDRPTVFTGTPGNNYALIPVVNNDDVNKFTSASWRFTPTATLTNEVRGGFNLAPAVFATTQQLGSTLLDGFLFNNPTNIFRAQGRDTNTYNVNDNATWVHGKHSVKFGGTYQSIRTAPYNDGGISPVYTIGLGTGHTGLTAAQLPGVSANDLTSANNLLANLTGAVSSSSQTFNITNQTSGFVNGATNLRHFVYDNYAFYVQDNWRVMPNLTIEAGLRYEYFVPLHEKDNLELTAQIPGGNVAAALLSPTTSFNYVKGGFYNADKKDFGPRIGFAWNVFGNNKTSIRGGYGIYFVNDEVIAGVRNSLETNPGLSSAATGQGLTQFASNLPAVPVPAYLVPRTSADNYNLSSTNAVGITNPGLKVPYVSQYSLSIQHEVKGTVISASYIGNHGTRLLRGTDYNQVDIKSSGFLADFVRAQNNGFLALASTGKFAPVYNAAITGSQPLTVFPLLAGGGLLTNATIISSIQTGQPGSLAQTYQTNGLNGSVNFFPNPNALGANYTSNGADSTYNSLQIDARRRLTKGLTMQVNYTWSKVLSNTAGDTQTNFEPFLDNNNPGAERAPAPFDLRHALKANGIYDLPMGPGHAFNPKGLGRLLGGWSVGSILVWQSGAPFSILTGARGTLNRGARSTYNTANALVSTGLADLVAFRMTGNGPYFVPASAIGSDGRGTSADGAAPFAGQLFANPGAGTIGTLQRRSFYGPSAFNQDVSILKDVRIRERQSLQFRMDATNVFNHATFNIADQATSTTQTYLNINSTTFGKVTTSLFGSRLVQLSMSYKF